MITPKFFITLATASTFVARSVPVTRDRFRICKDRSCNGTPDKPSCCANPASAIETSPNDSGTCAATARKSFFRFSSSGPVFPVFARNRSNASSKLAPNTNKAPTAIPTPASTPAPRLPAAFTVLDVVDSIFLDSLSISLRAFFRPASLKVERTVMLTATDQPFTARSSRSNFPSYIFTTANTSRESFFSPPASSQAFQINLDVSP